MILLLFLPLACSVAREVQLRGSLLETTGFTPEGKWRPLTDGERSVLLRKIRYEWAEDGPMKTLFYDNCKLCSTQKCGVPINGATRANGHPVALFVLGPSASGKTAAMKFHMDEILRHNHLLPLTFTTIDGGEMRKHSTVWAEMRTGCQTGCGPNKDRYCAGCSDQFDVFKPHIDKFKAFVFQDLLAQKTDMSIVDTGTGNWWSKGHGFYKDTVKPLVKGGYQVILTAVYATKPTCAASGESRSTEEGKIYSSAGWRLGMEMIRSVMNVARTKGNTNAFAIVRNNWNSANWPVTVELQEKLCPSLDFRCATGTQIFVCDTDPKYCLLDVEWIPDGTDALFFYKGERVAGAEEMSQILKNNPQRLMLAEEDDADVNHFEHEDEDSLDDQPTTRPRAFARTLVKNAQT